MDKKVFLLDAIKIDERFLFPIVLLKVSRIKNIYWDIEYEVLAFKIKEKDLTYFINIQLSENEFNMLKKLLNDI